VVAAELLVLAWLRHKFFQAGFARSFLAITVGGAIIAALSAALGAGSDDPRAGRTVDVEGLAHDRSGFEFLPVPDIDVVDDGEPGLALPGLRE
jgi:hypothetical protein